MLMNIWIMRVIESIKNWMRDALGIFNSELRTVLHDEGVMVIFIVAGFIYPILYNVIYGKGNLEEMPVAVVDEAACSESRRFLREVDATREVDLAYYCADMEEARELMRKRKANGIIYMPSDFGENISRREVAKLSIYCDMSSFIYYKNLMMGANLVMLQEVNDIKLEYFEMEGLTYQEAQQSVKPIPYDDNNPYNRNFSYSVFLLSAILMLIIQQVMLYGMSLSVGTAREENRSFASLPGSLKGRGVGRVVLGRGGVYWLMFMIIGVYIGCIIPAMFSFPQRGSFWDIFTLITIMVTVCVFFSMTWSTFITRRETVFILMLFMSLICAFLTGFSWPTSSFPGFWKYFSYLFPSTFGCQAFINLNTAGADLQTVAPQIRALFIQGMAYFVTACVAVYVENFVLRNKSRFKAVREKRIRRANRRLDRIENFIDGRRPSGRA